MVEATAFRIQQQQQQQLAHVLPAGYLRGLIFIVLVAIIWAASSVFVQFLYSSDKNNGGLSFNSPFLLTYIGTSLFTLWIPIKLISSSSSSAPPLQQQQQQQPHTQRRRRRRRRRARQTTTQLQLSCETASVGDSTTTYHNVPPPPSPSKESLHDSNEPDDNDNSHEIMDEEGIQLYPHTAANATENDGNHDDDDSSSCSSHGSLNAASSQRGLLMTAEQEEEEEEEASSSSFSCHHWTTRQHVMVAMQIAPIWFLANWSYNASLAYTSITSSTVLASTGSVFTFIFAVWTGDETFNSYKLAGVLLGVTGCLVTALHDASSSSSSLPNDANTNANDDNNNNLSLFGDCLGLVSAIGYGMYAVQTRVLCPHQEDLYSMELLLGFIGLINAIALSPLALYSYYYLQHHNNDGSNNNNNNTLTWLVLGCLVLKGLLDNALSDYLWLRAVILTSATVATVGLGLTIPLAFLSDLYLSFTGSSSVLSLTSIVGAVAVLMGFVLVNVGMNQENNNNNQNASTTQGHNHVLVGEVDSGNDNNDDNEPLGFVDNHHDSDAASDLILEEGHRKDMPGSQQTRSDIL